MSMDKQRLEQIIRVNQAGEYGAKRIYEGQLDFMRDIEKKELVEHMAEQEEEHLRYFNQELNKRRIRPTALSPLWHVGGYALGAVTAMMGTEAAMACTVAVEEVIDEHYEAQKEELKEAGGEEELVSTIHRFQEEECEHRDTGYEHGAEQAPAYPVLSGAIRQITRTAIWLSERV